jgi:hypothetical protein
MPKKGGLEAKMCGERTKEQVQAKNRNKYKTKNKQKNNTSQSDTPAGRRNVENPMPCTIPKTSILIGGMNHPQMVFVYARSEGSGVPGVPQRRLAAVALALSLSLAGGVQQTWDSQKYGRHLRKKN